MATNTRVYDSTDAGAPVLTGQVGSLISLLKTVLVGTAGVAYGSKAAVGWTKPYEDVPNNRVAFRNSLAAGGSGCYLRIDDNGGLGYGARAARCTLFFTMSDVNTGTEETPAVGTQAAGAVVFKSTTANSTARKWTIVADERTLYLNVEFQAEVPGSTRVLTCSFFAGDYGSDDASQPAPCGIGGHLTAAGSGVSASEFGFCNTWKDVGSASGLWLMRGPTRLAGPVRAGLIHMGSLDSGSNSVIGGDQQSFPNPQTTSGNTYFQPAQIGIWTSVTNKFYMGRMRGVWMPLSTTSGDTFGKNYTGGPGFGFTNLRLLKQNSNTLTSNTSALGGTCVETGENWP